MKVFFSFLPMFTLVACNLYGGIDKPSGDQQLLNYARACLNKGDYVCAQNYYQALSSNYSDISLSESTFNTLAQKGIFLMSDFITSLGDGTGSTNSFSIMAELVASRGKTDGTSRVIIQQTYTNAANIIDPTLKSYMKFISSSAMFNQIIANAVGNNGKLARDDFAVDPTLCAYSTCVTASDCTKPSNNLNDSVGAEVTDMVTATNWSTDATLNKAFKAASAANTAMSELGISGTNGLFRTLNSLSSTPGSVCLKRKLLLNTLFP